MNIIITEWALASYGQLLAANVFTPAEYWTTLRPDVELLRNFPTDPALQNNKLWSPADDPGGPGLLRGGYKMKWHNFGAGCVQLRLTVAIVGGEAILCAAYVKSSDHAEQRALIRFKRHLNLISMGQYIERGRL